MCATNQEKEKYSSSMKKTKNDKTTKKTKTTMMKNEASTIHYKPAYILSSSLVILLSLLLCLLASLVSYQVGVMARPYLTPEDSLSSSSSSSSSSSKSTGHDWIYCRNIKKEEDLLCSVAAKTYVDESENSSSSSSDDDDDDDDESNASAADAHLYGHHFMAALNSASMSASLKDLMAKFVQLTSKQGWFLTSHYCSRDSCILVFVEGHRLVVHRSTQTLDIFSTDDNLHVEWYHTAMAPWIRSQQWAYKPRAVPYNPAVVDAGMNDMYNFLLGSLEYTHKQLVVREETPFQEIAIYDTIDPRTASYVHYQKAIGAYEEDEDNYYRDNAHLFQPDRQMFLDGVVQSRRYGEKAYHEALVHPAMIAHSHPKRVAIIGAGEGATLREVLKHNTVEEVVMIEIDSLVMDVSRQYLTEWNDCSDIELPEGLVNPTGNCFDDPRATVYAKNAIAWFINNYPPSGTTHKLFDVIIMDALDPGDKVEFNDVLFDDIDLVATFYRALSPKGVFISQTGEEQFLEDPNPMWTRDKYALLFLQNLGKVGFKRFFDYDEGSTRFGGLWSFFVAAKDSDASRWFANSAEIDLELRQRAMPTKSGKWPFSYFDGATMQSYHVTTRSVAEVMCLVTPDSPACHRGPGLTDVGLDLHPEMYVGLDECVHQTWGVPHSAATTIRSMANDNDTSIEMSVFEEAIRGFGRPWNLTGEQSTIMDMGNDLWRKDRRVTQPPIESVTEGENNPMLERFWRIHSCAASRRVNFNQNYVVVS